MQVWYIPTFLWSLGSDLCLSLEEFLVSPPPYVCSSRSARTPSAFAAALRLCAALQVTLGDRLLPCRRSVGLLSSPWPEFRKTRSSKAYMCTQCACQAVRHRFSCGWCNMLKLSQPAHTGSTFQGKSSRKRLRSVHSTFNELCATVCLLCHVLFFFYYYFHKCSVGGVLAYYLCHEHKFSSCWQEVMFMGNGEQYIWKPPEDDDMLMHQNKALGPMVAHTMENIQPSAAVVRKHKPTCHLLFTSSCQYHHKYFYYDQYYYYYHYIIIIIIGPHPLLSTNAWFLQIGHCWEKGNEQAFQGCQSHC